MTSSNRALFAGPKCRRSASINMLRKTLISKQIKHALALLRQNYQRSHLLDGHQRSILTATTETVGQEIGKVRSKGDLSRSVSSYVSPSGVTFHFDTHKLVSKLQDSDFSAQQSESITSCLVEIIHSSISSLASKTVTTLEKERMEMKWKSIYDEVRNEMFLLEKSKFAQLKEENLKLKEKVKALEQLMQDELNKMKGGMRLDMSLEKSRRSEELAIRDQRIKDNGNKIETEIAKLGTQLESQKLDLIKYLVGSLVSCTTLILAFWRFAKS